MNKIFLISSIGVIFLSILGGIVYYGINALQPATYTSLTVPPPTTFETSLPSPPTTIAAPPAAAPGTIMLATNEEQQRYHSSAALPEINPTPFKLPLLDITAMSYRPNEVFIIEKSSAAATASVWKYDVKKKTLAPIFENERGLAVSWLQNGNFTLTFALDAALQPSLVISNAATTQKLTLPFITLPEKCGMDPTQPIVYCAVPIDIPPGTTLPDDYWQKAFYSQDRILRIDMPASRVTEIMDEYPPIDGGKLDAVTIVIDANNLFFTNRYDGKVYTLAL